MSANILGGLVKTREDLERVSEKRGNKCLQNFCRAIDRLQEGGFVTELWVDARNQAITLRWVKNGAKWHIHARGLKVIDANLEQIGMQASAWLREREHGSGKEENYAVRES